MSNAATTATVYIITTEHGPVAQKVGTTLEQAKAKCRAARDAGVFDFIKLSRETRTIAPAPSLRDDPRYAHITDEQLDGEQAELAAEC